MIKWLKKKFGKKEPEEVIPVYLEIPSSDYPAREDWELLPQQEHYLERLNAHYYYEIVRTTNSFIQGKETKETLVALTAKQQLIKQLLGN